VAVTGSPEALAALAHALGEALLLEGNADAAAAQFQRAAEFLEELDLPLQRAQTYLRAGVALVRAGDRELGVERLTSAYHLSRQLGAPDLAKQAAGELT